MIIFLIVLCVIAFGVFGVEIYKEEREHKKRLLHPDVYEEI